MFIDYNRQGFMLFCTFYGNEESFVVEIRTANNYFHTTKIDISGFLNVKHRLKEIPRLHEEFRREIGTLFLDQLSISDDDPSQSTAPQPSGRS